MGTTPLRVYEVSDFKGINLHDEARRIAPGEFTILTNASTDNASIKADAVDALIAMPIPKIITSNLNKFALNYPWVGNCTATGSANKNKFAISLSASNFTTANGSLASGLGDSVGALIPYTLSAGTVSGNEWYTLDIYAGDSNGNIPSGNSISVKNGSFGYCSVTATASTYFGDFFVSRDVLITSNSLNPTKNKMAVIKGATASGAGININNFNYTTATAGDTWATGSPGNVGWSCVITKNNNYPSGHILNIFPFTSLGIDKQGTIKYSTTTTNTYRFDENGFTQSPVSSNDWSLSRIYVSGEPLYKGSFVTWDGCGGSASAALMSGDIFINRFSDMTLSFPSSSPFKIYNDFNLVDNNEVLSLCAPEHKNGISFDFGWNSTTDNFDLGTLISPRYTYLYNSNYFKKKRKSQSCFFNGYLVPVRNGSLCAYQFNQSMGYGVGTQAIKVQPLSTVTFTAPRGVISYNTFLMFYNVVDIATGNKYSYRMYFSTAGMIDAFSSNQYENFSDGEEVFWVEEWYGSLIIFFADKIKRYTGTPGNATLETIWYRGVSCAEVVCKTGRGILFVSTDGLYMYNGTFNRVTDLSTKFDQANSRNLTEDGWMEFNDKAQELYFYPGYDSIVNVWDAKNNVFRQKDYTTAVCSAGMRFFKYYHNMDLKTAISYPSITHVSQVEAGTTHQAVTIQSGWIDVDEGQGNSQYEQKRFDSAIIETSGQASNAIAQIDKISGTPVGTATVNVTLNTTVIPWTFTTTEARSFLLNASNSNRITIAAHTDFDVAANNKSFTCWINKTTAWVSGLVLFCRSDGSTGFYIQTTAGGNIQVVNDVGVSAETADNVGTEGAWHHWAFVKTAGAAWKIYKDTVEVSYVSQSATNPGTISRTLYIGSYDNGTLNFGAGMAEFHWYSTALTPAEVTSDYQFTPAASLVTRLKMDETAGTNSADSGTGGHAGTVVGTQDAGFWNANGPWVPFGTATMVTQYEALTALINATTEPVVPSYVNSGDHSQGIYITANVAGVPFTCTLSGNTGTLARSASTANSIGNSTDYYNFIINFDDGTSVSQNNILISPLGTLKPIISTLIPLNYQAKLVQYKITSPAQTSQLVVHKIKFLYDDTMLK